MEAKLEVPKEIRLTLTILDYFVSSLSHCNCAIKVKVETNSRIPYIRAKYHEINLYYVVLSTTHQSLMFRDVLLNYYIQAYDDVYYKSTKLDFLGFYWIFIDWLDPYMKFDVDMQIHVATSSPYLML